MNKAMRCLKLIALLPVLLLPACVHVHESSANANIEQIKTHLMAQLHCQSLELVPDGKNSFSGNGKNDSGPFTIHVKREKEKIVFEGAYTANAKFNGTASWTKNYYSFGGSVGGFHKSRETSQSSISSQSSGN